MLMLILGLLMLTMGGEALIRGAMGVARKLNISPLFCGIVIVGFGTSAPELVVSVTAMLQAKPGVALGNVIGSNIGNILLILGLCTLLRPLHINRLALKKDTLCLLAVSLVCCALVSLKMFTVFSGAFLLMLLISYVVSVYDKESKNKDPSAVMHIQESAVVPEQSYSGWLLILFVLAGLAMLIGGAHLFTLGAIGIAKHFELSATLIGLTLVAIGTSLPEITISVMATLRQQNDVAIGNVLGSNIFNILGILGISSLISPIAVSQRIFVFDQWVLLVSALIAAIFVFAAKKISRSAGLIMLTGYSVYIWWGVVQFNV